MQLNQLTRPASLKRAYRRVGRGQSSTRGKQSGRGGKGQTARAGNKRRPELRDIIKKLPKRRGFGKNRGRTVVGTRLDAIAISVERLGVLFDSGAEVTHKILVAKGIISGRMMPPVKIVGPSTKLGASDLGKKLSLRGIPVSASARAAIEKAGGTIDLVAPAVNVKPTKPSKPVKPTQAAKKLKS